MRPCSLLAGIRVERGTMSDWRVLAPLHYRGHRAGAVTDVFRLVYEAPPAQSAVRNPRLAIRIRLAPVLVGVIVYSHSPLSLAARNRATAGRYRLGGLGRTSAGPLVNRDFRIVSRVVIAPNWRGLGLAVRLVRETMPQVASPYVEALAAMGEVHPFFARAGMTAYSPAASREGERLRAAFDALGLGRADRRSAGALEAALARLEPGPRRLAEAELDRWARSYLGAKNHRVNRPDRGRVLDLVARHLDGAPVYYLWRREMPCD